MKARPFWPDEYRYERDQIRIERLQNWRVHGREDARTFKEIAAAVKAGREAEVLAETPAAIQRDLLDEELEEEGEA